MRAAQTLGEKGFLRRMPGRSRYGTLRFQIVEDRLRAGDTVSPCDGSVGTQSPTPGDTESPHRGQGVPQSTKTPQRTEEEATAAAGELILDDRHIPQIYHDRALADGWGAERIRQEWEMFVLWHQEKGTVPTSQSETPWLRLWAKWRRRSRSHDPALPPALPPAEALQSPLIAEARALANMA